MPLIPLSELKKGLFAKIQAIVALNEHDATDAVTIRLSDLGFCPGENVQVLALTPFKLGPIVVKLGNVRFALRHNEATRILVNEIATL